MFLFFEEKAAMLSFIKQLQLQALNAAKRNDAMQQEQATFYAKEEHPFNVEGTWMLLSSEVSRYKRISYWKWVWNFTFQQIYVIGVVTSFKYLNP